MKSKLSGVLATALVLGLFPATAFADDGGSGYLGVGAGLAMGLAVLGAGLGQGRLGGSAMEGMARNPQAAGEIRTSMLLGMAFPESLVLFAFAIAYLVQANIHVK